MTRIASIALTATLSIFGAATPASAGEMIPATGEFTVAVDFATLTLTPVGANCLLEVEGVAVFTGTLDGVAPGKTRALVLGSCEAVGATPPGTFKDTFSSALAFAGTVNGEPVLADITYRGITAVGGDIDAIMQPSNGLAGVLEVEAIVAVGGTYAGFVKLD